jgi:hypothetical protein
VRVAFDSDTPLTSRERIVKEHIDWLG